MPRRGANGVRRGERGRAVIALVELLEARAGIEREQCVRRQAADHRGGLLHQQSLVDVLEFAVAMAEPVQVALRDVDAGGGGFLFGAADLHETLVRHRAIARALVVVGVHHQVDVVGRAPEPREGAGRVQVVVGMGAEADDRAAGPFFDGFGEVAPVHGAECTGASMRA